MERSCTKDKSINCTLSADINMAGKEWTPIGTDENNSYNGTFDGNGKTITGLTVNQSEKTMRVCSVVLVPTARCRT